MGRYLIWGGSGGIGAAVARRLSAEGHAVHLAARDAAKLEAVARETGATFTVADALEPDAVRRASEEGAAGGALDGLCYAVGSINLKPAQRLTDADVEGDFRLNALGAFRAIQAALPALKKAEGTASILLFSTIAVAQGFTAHASVAMAKGAVEGLVHALGAELAPKIRINAIAPSLTRTPLASALTANASVADAIAALHPLQRLGEVDDIAPMAALLLGPGSGWITGQVIGVDGGRSTLRTKG